MTLALPLASARIRGGLAHAAFGLTPAELEGRGLGPSLFSRLHRPWLWDAGGPRLSASARDRLGELGVAVPRLLDCLRSSDGSSKLAVELSGQSVEAVHMPRAVRAGRVTLCVSSQVGCALGCAFCATGRLGLLRQLSAAEIVAQILAVVARLGPRHPGALTLVFMGMGEPLHNFDALARALELLTDARGLGLSPRRITVSTAGLVPEIARLATLPRRPLLAISLSAARPETRAALMPIARRYSLSALKQALAHYPLRPRERITVEYVLLAGVNDSPGDARSLADFCDGFPHQINLIPWNPVPGTPFAPPDEAALERFVRALLSRRPCLISVRRSRAADVAGACGQLVGTELAAQAEAAG